jgi:hypothetical protein
MITLLSTFTQSQDYDAMSVGGEDDSVPNTPGSKLRDGNPSLAIAASGNVLNEDEEKDFESLLLRGLASFPLFEDKAKAAGATPKTQKEPEGEAEDDEEDDEDDEEDAEEEDAEEEDAEEEDAEEAEGDDDDDGDGDDDDDDDDDDDFVIAGYVEPTDMVFNEAFSDTVGPFDYEYAEHQVANVELASDKAEEDLQREPHARTSRRDRRDKRDGLPLPTTR